MSRSNIPASRTESTELAGELADVKAHLLRAWEKEAGGAFTPLARALSKVEWMLAKYEPAPSETPPQQSRTSATRHLPKGDATVSISQNNGKVSLNIGLFVVAEMNPGLASIGFDLLDVADHIAKALNSAASSETTAPKRWKLVPKQPTQEMLAAASGSVRQFGYHRARIVYEAMLKAAPDVPRDER